MTFLRSALAFQFLVANWGLRKRPQAGSLSVNEHPFTPDCLLGSGFAVEGGCQRYLQAIQPVRDCKIADFDEACHEVSNAESVSGYMRDVRSSSDYSSLTRSVTEAEGGGFGVSVSASFSYMKSSQVSEKSLAFFIGASGRTERRTLQNTVSMKLTTPAKDLLRRNASEFITVFGHRYIHSIAYGGSFLGSVTVNSKATADDRDVQAFAAFSVNKGFFSASGSTEFQNTLSQQNIDVSTFINAKWVGGSGIVQDYQSPETLNNMFQDWDSTWRLNPEPKTITTRRWIDSAEVQEIVFAMSDEDKALFYSPDITPAIHREISQENAKVVLTDTSVKKALAWQEVQEDQSAQTCLMSLSREVIAKLILIDRLTDVSVLVIQQQWVDGIYAWFEADNFHARYLQCVENIEVPMPVLLPGSYYIRFAQTVEEQPGGWYLTSHGRSIDRRDHSSNFVFLHENAGRQKWDLELVPNTTDEFYIRFAEAAADQPAGWYLTGHGRAEDYRDYISSKVMVHQTAGKQPWKLIPVSGNRFLIQFSQNTHGQPGGWRLSAHGRSNDHRDDHSNFAMLHGAAQDAWLFEAA